MTFNKDSLAPCRNRASTLVVVGVGDGSIVEAIKNEPGIAAKDIRIIVFPGETIPENNLPTLVFDRVWDWNSGQDWAFRRFASHADVIRLGGVDIIDSHPISPEAEAIRADLWPRLSATLNDRPWSLGNDINDTFMGLYHAGLNAERLLPAPSLGQIAGCFGQTPIISIAAGPSVSEHLDELRALQEKCILVACDAIYEPLLKEGIVPHFVTPLERLKQQTSLVQAAQGTRTIFAGIAACHPDLVRLFGDRTIYVHALDKLYDWLAPKEQLRCLTGSSTGVLSFLIAASLTRGPVYLVGHDLAKDAHGETHFSGAAFARKAQQAEVDKSGEFGANGYERRLIPGNDGNPVESIMWWDTFRLEISSQANLIPGRVFNVNAHTGKYARIENTGAAPLPEPGSLPDLPEIRIVHANQDRLSDWRHRAKLLPDDCRHLQEALGAFRSDCARSLAGDPRAWDLQSFLGRLTPHMGVSPGNTEAFSYFLRSAFTNEQMYMSYRARSFKSREHAYYHTMRSLDALADALHKAIEHVTPCLEEIARACH